MRTFWTKHSAQKSQVPDPCSRSARLLSLRGGGGDNLQTLQENRAETSVKQRLSKQEKRALKQAKHVERKLERKMRDKEVRHRITVQCESLLEALRWIRQHEIRGGWIVRL